MKSISMRLVQIEKLMRRDPLLLRTVDGAVLPVRDVIEQGIEWERVVGGSDLNDLDRLLMTIRKGAEI